MKRNQTTTKIETAKLPAAQSTRRATTRSFIAGRMGILGCAALLLMAAGSALAQTTNIVNVTNTLADVPATVSSVTLESYTGDKGRLTIAVNQTNSSATEVKVTLGGATVTNYSTTNFIDPDYYITNYTDITPKVATLAATGVPATGGGAGVVLGSQSITNTAAGNSSVNVAVTLNYTNLASGDYDMAVEATGTGTWRYPIPVKAGFMWGAGGGADTNFSNTANWVGGVPPGSGDIVILDTAGAVVSATQPTIAITSDTTIGSVSDIHTGDNYTHWNIAAGTTLSITNVGGFRQLVDIIDTAQRSRIRASGAGTLIVSNSNAEFNFTTTRQNNSHDSADFSALNILILDVRKIAFNDIGAYPNYGTNGITTKPSANVYDMDWALTNILRATLTDANGWTNNTRDYSMVINRERQQTGSDGGMHFGLWNELYMDSILFGGYSQMENPEVDFRAASGSYIKIRNTDGASRLSNLTIADAMDYYADATKINTGGTKIDVSFTKGTNDSLIETLIIGRDPLVTANGPANGKLFLGAGTFDVNSAILGYQTGSGAGTESGAAQGRVELSLGGLFRVNDTLVLGYTVTNLPTVTGGFGQLLVSGAGSTAQINSITVGGPANASIDNTLTINSGGNLVVSNAIAAPGARVNTLTMTDGIFSFNLAAGTTNAFVNSIVTSGTSNVLKVLSVTGIASYPATNPVISYVNVPAPNFSVDVSALGAGFYAFVLNNTAGQTIDLLITTNPPKSLVWSGAFNGNWDNSTTNWIPGNQTFVPGDHATFDDASDQTNVTIVGNQLLGQTPGIPGLLVTNNTKHYTYATGTATGTIRKEGAAEMTMDGTHSGSLTIAGGSVTGSGTLGATTVNAGTTLDYLGAVSALTTAGTVVNGGTVNGAVAMSGGTMVNNATIAASALSITGGTILSNSASGKLGRAGAATTLPAGFVLVNNGQITNVADRINANTAGSRIEGDGTFLSGAVGFDTGGIGRILVASGGILSPGNGTSNLATMTVQSRIDFNTGGFVLIECDPAGPANDNFVADYVGNMQATFIMSNVTATPFAVGQTFTIVTSGTGLVLTNGGLATHVNQIPLVSPVVPGVGMQWNRIGMTNFSTTRFLSVVAAPLTSPFLTNVFTPTNLTMNWPATHLGYQLKVQTNTLPVGLSSNWFPIVGSENTNSWTVLVDTNQPTVFYRLSNQP